MLRLFIAIPLPKEAKEFIKGTLADVRKKASGIHDICFQPEENWHFTLIFLGAQKEESLSRIQKALQDVKLLIRPLEIPLFRVLWGPQGNTARMIWIETNAVASRELEKIKNMITAGLEREKIIWKKDNRPFCGHITLARFHPILKKRLLAIEEKLDFAFQPEAIHLMKSVLKRGGVEYETLYEMNF